MDEKKTIELKVEELEERIAPAHFILPVVTLPAMPPVETGTLPIADAPP